jgi:hypothetical protein
VADQARIEAGQLPAFPASAQGPPGDRHAGVALVGADADADLQVRVQHLGVPVGQMRLEPGADLVRDLVHRAAHRPGELPDQVAVPGRAQVPGDRLQLGRRVGQPGHSTSP